MNFLFFCNSVLLGAGLAMDAFTVSLANGLSEPQMRRKKMCLIALVFALFQTAMPLIGWVCVHTIATRFAAFEKWIPWISLALLGFIGGKMLVEGIRDLREKRACEKAVAAGANAAANGTVAAGDGEGPAVSCEIPHRSVGIWALMVQGIATSIDALSVGFTIAENPFWQASVSALIIGVVTFGICLAGVLLGKRFGTGLSAVATVVGGGILIAIGIEIFVKGMWF